MVQSISQPTFMPNNPLWSRLRKFIFSTDALVAGTLLLAVVILWLPFGFKSGLTGDAWHFYAESDRGVRIETFIRPFHSTAWRIAYQLTPGRFEGANLLQLGLMFSKGWLFYAILKKFKVRLDFAFAIAILAAIFPADDGVFFLGILLLHLIVFCYLAALYMLLQYWEKPSWIYVIAIWIAQALCLGTYEAGFPLVLVTPIVLLLLESRLTRRLIRAALVWSIVPITAIVWLVQIVLTQPGMVRYQSSLVIETTISSVVSSLLTFYQRNFIDGWLPSTGNISPLFIILAIATGVVVFGVTRRLITAQNTSEPSKYPKHYIPVIIIGLVLMVVGFAVFLPTTVRNDIVRTYYFSSLGGAITIAAILGWITLARLRRPLLFALGISIFAFLATLRLLDQHQYYNERSNTQQATAVQLASVIRQLPEGTSVIVLDESEDQRMRQVFDASWYFRVIMDILYENYGLGTALCYPQLTEPWGGFRETCRFGEQDITTTDVGEVFVYAPYDQVVVVKYTEAEGFVIQRDLSAYGVSVEAQNLYQPDQLLIPDSELPRRASSLFAH